jgi:hypothetical protein
MGISVLQERFGVEILPWHLTSNEPDLRKIAAATGANIAAKLPATGFCSDISVAASIFAGLGGFLESASAEAAAAESALPELRISASTYPELAENILNAQKAGHPSVLTYGGNIAANRAAALEGVPNIRGLTRDEYPFASSMQGGGGSWVGHVPLSQQNAQGALLKNFFKQNNIMPGDQYRVIVGP